MNPLIEAHRGDSINAPENTLAAFARALRLGVPWIELDVHPARDGTPMVIHDRSVDRTTNGSGAVCELAVRQLLELDAGVKFSPAFAGEKIPRLLDVLEMISTTPVRINIEIKTSPAEIKMPEAVVELLRRFNRHKHYIVSSFNLQTLLEVRTIEPAIGLALIGNGPEILRLAEQHKLPWIHCKHTSLNREIVELAHEKGIMVNAWTVDQPEKLPFWRQLGVNKLCTNRPAIMQSAAATQPATGGPDLAKRR